MKNNSEHSKLNFSLITIPIIFYLIFSVYQINIEDLWFDEMATFWVTNPFVDNSTTYQNILLSENTPPIYYYVVKYFFNLFGYNPYILRVPNIFFFLISIYIFYLIIIKFSIDRKFILFSLLLFSLNHFLISYSHEGRVYIFYLLTSLFLINSYLNLIDRNNNNLKFLLFFLFSFISINTFLFSFIIIGSIFLFEIFFMKKNKDFFIINIILILSILLSYFINLDFFNKMLTFNPSSIQNPSLDFYLFNFFFKQYFGSKIMGYLFIIAFIYSVYLIIKEKFYFDKMLFLFLLLISSYLVPIIYGYIISPVLLDKYIIYVVPVIILFIGIGFSRINYKFKNYLMILFLTVTLANQVIKNIKKEINKPEFTKILEFINNNEKITFFKTSFGDNGNKFHNEYLSNYLFQIIKFKKFKLDMDSKTKNELYWLVCYDPSNTYKYCTKKNELINGQVKIEKIIKKYQAVALLLNNK